LIEFLEPGTTINAAHYVQSLLKLCRALRDERPGRKVILQHNNARPHTVLEAMWYAVYNIRRITHNKHAVLQNCITNIMHSLFIYFRMYFCLTCFRPSLSPSSRGTVFNFGSGSSLLYMVSASGPGWNSSNLAQMLTLCCLL
jgi:hypothetical protein